MPRTPTLLTQRDGLGNDEAKEWYPCRDSNPGTWFRKPLLYPLSYRGTESID